MLVLEYGVEGDLPAERLKRAVQLVAQAANDWKQAGGPSIELRARPAHRASSEDGHSTLRWVRHLGNCDPSYAKPCLPGHMLGVTYLYTVEGTEHDRHILEVDVMMDMKLLAQPEQLLAVARHELGHVLGLRDASDGTNMGSVMHFPSHHRYQSQLQACDVAAAQALYSRDPRPE